jgi:trimeric autotransporter adhesin
MTRVAVALQFTLLCVASTALRAQTSPKPVTSQPENISPAQTSPQSSAPVPSRAGATVHGGTIFGFVKQGTIPLSGVLIIVRDEETKNKFTTITDGAGTYSVRVADDGRYSIRFVFRALTSSPQQIAFGPRAARKQEADFSFEGSAGANSLTSEWPALIMPPVAVSTISLQPTFTNPGGTSGAQFPQFPGDPNFSGDSFTVNGQAPIVTPYFQMADQMRADFEDGHELQGPAMRPEQTSSHGTSPTTSGRSEDSSTGDAYEHSTTAESKPHGEIFWTGGTSALNAQPYLIAGHPIPNPGYNSNGYGITIGAQPFLPGLTKPSARDYILISYAGGLASTVVSDYGVVPTELERAGNFSQLADQTGALIPIFPPKTTVPFPNNTINTPLDPAALALLHFLPEPNITAPGGINYHLLTTQGTHGNTLGVSYSHNFGALAAGGTSAQTSPQSLNVNFNFGDLATDVINIFPQLSGKQRTQNYALTVGYTIIKGEWFTNINVTSSRNNAQVRNPFTNGEDIASKLGIFADTSTTPATPVNTNPQNFGLPNLVFNGFTGFSETQPNFQLTQTLSASGSTAWSHGSHVVRFGGDVDRVEFNLFGGTDATGTYTFTGGYTQIEGASNDNPVSATGNAFADFLLGLPQQTKIESPVKKAYTRQTIWDIFVRDDWHIRRNLTLVAGLRYDYFSPFVETQNRLSTLDFNSDFSVVAPVQPGQIGSVSGQRYPRSLVHPDRNNFSPHFGVAWQTSKNTVLRSAYGINYTVAQYGSFIQNLAYQPPFASVQVNGNLPHVFTLFTLQNGFGNLTDFGNYAVNPNYRLPYVQVWYLDIQRQLPLGLVLDVGYTGSKGADLDIISAPGPLNLTPFANAYFDFENSTAFSKYNALVVRINKRLGAGFALQTTYTYSHSIDNASSINAGIPVVAQNPNDLAAEESNSSFDLRHQLTGSFLYQLPFGSQKKYLHEKNWVSRVVGDWTLAGYFTVATGFPLTPYISASVAEVERGTHGSVRPNRVPGVSLTAGGGHLVRWFNTAAFSTTFMSGQLYGNASRFSIPGPGTQTVNLSLSKVFPLRDAKSLELRGTASNAFNIVQYSGVDTQYGSTALGQVDAVQPMRQITFLARFRF